MVLIEAELEHTIALFDKCFEKAEEIPFSFMLDFVSLLGFSGCH